MRVVVPCGRLHKGDGSDESIIKNVKSETGLVVEDVMWVFPVIEDTIFTIGEDRHSLNITLIVRHVEGLPDLRKDMEAPRFINGIETYLHPYVKETIRKSDFFRPDIKRFFGAAAARCCRTTRYQG